MPAPCFDRSELERYKNNTIKVKDLSMEVPIQEEKQANCSHEFHFLRADAKDVTPGAYHGDKEIFDVFYCTKCLQYREVAKGRVTYDSYVFNQQNR